MIQRACRALLFDTSSYHYKACRRGQADLRIREISDTRVRHPMAQPHREKAGKL